MRDDETGKGAAAPSAAGGGLEATVGQQALKQAGEWRFLRRRSVPCALSALCLLGACAGAVWLCVLYHASRVTLPVYYFTTRPAFVWFAFLAPGLALGVFGVRRRWLLLCVLLWCGCLVASEDVRQLCKLFPEGARERFATERMAFAHFLSKGKLEGDVLRVPLRVVSWNVAAGKMGGEGVVRALDDMDADVILMQEFVWGAETLVGGPLKHAPRLRGFSQKMGRQAVLSRYPLAEISRLRQEEEWRCSVVRVEVTPEAPLFIVNVHLSAPFLRTQILLGWTPEGLRGEMENTRRELDGIEEIVAHYSRLGPVIVAGDFNLPPTYPGLQFLRKTHKDCFAVNGYGWGKTAKTRLRNRHVPAQMRVDMIWVPGGAKVHYAASVCGDASDHNMVLAEITLPVGRGVSSE